MNILGFLAGLFGVKAPGEKQKINRLIAANPRGEEFARKAEAAHAKGDDVKARYWARKAIGLQP